MFSSQKFIAFVRKPSPYYLQKMLTDEQRKNLLKSIQHHSAKPISISPSNPVYRNINELVRRDEEEERQKYEDSFWWSPRFTPRTFKLGFLPLFIFVLATLLYHNKVMMPRKMLEWKQKRGIRFEQLEAKGTLDGWLHEYIRKDQALEFEAHNLEDLEKLYKEGVIGEKRGEASGKKKNKFMRGNK